MTPSQLTSIVNSSAKNVDKQRKILLFFLCLSVAMNSEVYKKRLCDLMRLSLPYLYQGKPNQGIRNVFYMLCFP